MRSFLRRGAFGAALILAAACAPAAQAVEVQTVKSPKGIVAWLVVDRTAPILSVSFAFRGGTVRDPAGKEGLSFMMSTLLDEGAGDLDSLAFQRRLEDLSISFRFDVGRDAYQGSLRTLTRHRGEAFRLLGLALAKPRFDAEPLERSRAQIVSQLTRDQRNPQAVAQRAWIELAYAGHIYSRPVQGTPETIKTVTAAELKALHGGALARDNLIVGVVGDISPAELGTLLDAAFADLPEKSAPYAVPPVTVKPAGETVVKRMPFPQSAVVFGHEGVKRSDKDFYAAYVINHILGGGSFSSRLYQEVREKRGLAYSVYTYLNPLERGALYIGGVGTQNERVKESIEVIRAEWRRMAEGGVTQEEVDAAKQFITGSYPLRFSSAEQIARMLTEVQLEGLEQDFFDKRNAYMNAVTLDDVKRVAKRMLQPDSLIFVIVGSPAGL